MKYGLSRRLNVYSVEGQHGEEVIALAGDYLNAEMWCSANLAGMEQGVRDLYQTFAWAWFALKRLGRLDAYGIAGELSQDALTDMANTVTVYMDSVEEDSLPLKGSATPQRK